MSLQTSSTHPGCDSSEILPTATPGMARYAKRIATGLSHVDYINRGLQIHQTLIHQPTTDQRQST